MDKQKLENELSDSQNLNKTLGVKLDESLKSLESNAQLIQWFNKHLNEKHSSLSSGLFNPAPKPPTSKEPTTFKPSFSSVDQLNKSTPKASAQISQSSPQRSSTFSANPLKTQDFSKAFEPEKSIG